ncbi:hypothetical protein B0H17DRAFT_1150756 [Mycena rosella]|uniref:Uncharacterized protein n=1 Tax=Mycena rosella TaxID=1033263 RepID=A0AAD7BRM3_MYCRO|nr:hypothetical protein B0H17DRAFT_1150756 [Mycena rosella]
MKSSVTWENSHNFQAGIFMASNVGSELCANARYVWAALPIHAVEQILEPMQLGECEWFGRIEKALHMGDRGWIGRQLRASGKGRDRGIGSPSRSGKPPRNPKNVRVGNVHRFELQKRGQGPMKNSGTMGPASNIMIIEAVFKHEVDILEIRNGQSRGEECLADRGKKMWGTVRRVKIGTGGISPGPVVATGNDMSMKSWVECPALVNHNCGRTDSE